MFSAAVGVLTQLALVDVGGHPHATPWHAHLLQATTSLLRGLGGGGGSGGGGGPDPGHHSSHDDAVRLSGAARMLSAMTEGLTGREDAAYVETITQLLNQVLGSLLRAGGLRAENVSSWEGEGLLLVLESWGSLEEALTSGRLGAATPTPTPTPTPGVVVMPPPPHTTTSSSLATLVARGAAQAYEGILQAKLALASEDATDDDDDRDADGDLLAWHDRWAVDTATLGRIALPEVTTMLVAAVEANRVEIQHATSLISSSSMSSLSGGGGPIDYYHTLAVGMERFGLLREMLAYLLADDGDGEIPCPPLRVLAAPEAAYAGSHALVRATFDDLTSAHSPRAMEVVVGSLARWADTYLMLPAVEVGPHLAELAGPALVAQLATLAQQILVTFPGEGALHLVVARRLLGAISRHERVACELVQCPAWLDFTNAFAGVAAGVTAPEYENLPAKVHRWTAMAMMQAASGSRDAVATQSYARQVIAATVAPLAALGRQLPPAVGGGVGGSSTTTTTTTTTLTAQDVAGPTGDRVVRCLERLLGYTKGCPSRAQRVLWEAFAPCLAPLATLLAAAGGVDAVLTHRILKLAGYAVETHVLYLDPAAFHGVCAWVLALLRTYQEQRRAAGSAPPVASLRTQLLRERCKDARSLLRILRAITNRDLLQDDDDNDDDNNNDDGDNNIRTDGERREGGVDPRAGGGGGPPVQFGAAAASASASASSSSSTSSAAEVVLTGLVGVVTLLDTEILQFPKLAEEYASLLAFVMDTYPTAVTAMPREPFETLLSTILFCVTSLGSDCQLAATEALYFYLKWHVTSRVACPVGVPDRVAAAVGHAAVHGDAAGDALEATADVLLAALRGGASARVLQETLLAGSRAAAGDGAAPHTGTGTTTTLGPAGPGAGPEPGPGPSAVGVVVAGMVEDLVGAAQQLPPGFSFSVRETWRRTVRAFVKGARRTLRIA